MSQLTILDKNPNSNHKYKPAIAVLASNILNSSDVCFIIFINIIYKYYQEVLFRIIISK
jgi:hypothetical protein